MNRRARRQTPLPVDEVIECAWAPVTALEQHTHPYGVKALVVQGELWLTVGGLAKHL